MSDARYASSEQDTVLYTQAILDVIAESGLDVDALLENIVQTTGAVLDRYPDGTVQFEGPRMFDAFESRAGDCYFNRSQQLQVQEENYAKAKVWYGDASYSSLAPFSPRMFLIRDWGTHVHTWTGGGGGGIGVWTANTAEPDFPGPRREEAPIDNLLVSVEFQRRLSKKTRQQFTEAIGQWFLSVRVQGLFGEGPVSLASPHIQFHKRLAQFRIDASRSGQKTINWLILTLVHFASEHVITDIFFTLKPAGSDISFEEYYRFFEDTLVTLPIPGLSPAPGEIANADTAANREQEEAEPNDTSHVPDDAQPMEIVTSEHFRVLVALPFEIDSLTITIHFEQLPNAQDRKDFSKYIRSWCAVAQIGGFGGHGFRHCEKLKYKKETESASLFCDMGLADFDLSIKVLVFLLDSWHTQGRPPIEALVVGTPINGAGRPAPGRVALHHRET